MADLTSAEVASRVLEMLGVNGAGQSPSSEDSNRAGEAIDSAYKRLRKVGLAPFLTSAVPDWAQTPLIAIVAADLLATFGVGGERGQLVRSEATQGMVELARYMQAKRHPVAIRARYY